MEKSEKRESRKNGGRHNGDHSRSALDYKLRFALSLSPETRQELNWVRNTAKPFLLRQRISYLRENPEIWQKIMNSENWIVKRAITELNLKRI